MYKLLATKSTVTSAASSSSMKMRRVFLSLRNLAKTLPKAATNLLLAHSTVEGCDSVRDRDNGTWYIQKLCRVLKTWSKYEGVNILAQMMVLNFEMNTEVERYDTSEGQTSTFTSYLTHAIYYKQSDKYELIEGSSYPSRHQYKGRAYIYYDKMYANEANEFKATMEKLLLLPILCEIDHGDTALTDICKISYQNNFHYENCVIFAIFTKCETIINNNVPLKLIYDNFSVQNCPSLGNKPKMFFFFDAKYTEQLDIKMDSVRMQPMQYYVTNHADFLICRGHSKEFLTSLNHEMLRSLKNPIYDIIDIITIAKANEDQDQEYTSNFDSTLGRSFSFYPQRGAQTPKSILDGTSVHTPIVRYNTQRPVPLFTGREDEINTLVSETSSKSSGRKVITLFGMSGVGKTQIVRTFCTYFTWMFNNILFINAESEEKLNYTFEQIAINLKLISENKNLNPKNIVLLVYEYFKKSEKTLFIFDNYTEKALEYLPDHVGSHEIYVIITTNITKNPIKDQILIDVQNFNKNNAIEFLRKILDTKIHSDDDLEKLAEFLGYNPLSLHLSACHIKEETIRVPNYSINIFLQEFTKDTTKSMIPHFKDLYDKKSTF